MPTDKNTTKPVAAFTTSTNISTNSTAMTPTIKPSAVSTTLTEHYQTCEEVTLAGLGSITTVEILKFERFLESYITDYYLNQDDEIVTLVSVSAQVTNSAALVDRHFTAAPTIFFNQSISYRTADACTLSSLQIAFQPMKCDSTAFLSAIREIEDTCFGEVTSLSMKVSSGCFPDLLSIASPTNTPTIKPTSMLPNMPAAAVASLATTAAVSATPKQHYQICGEVTLEGLGAITTVEIEKFERFVENYSTNYYLNQNDGILNLASIAVQVKNKSALVARHDTAISFDQFISYSTDKSTLSYLQVAFGPVKHDSAAFLLAIRGIDREIEGTCFGQVTSFSMNVASGLDRMTSVDPYTKMSAAIPKSPASALMKKPSSINEPTKNKSLLANRRG